MQRSIVVMSRKPLVVQTMWQVCRHWSKHISLRCRAGRPQFDTEGVAVIMTDVKVLSTDFHSHALLELH